MAHPHPNPNGHPDAHNPHPTGGPHKPNDERDFMRHKLHEHLYKLHQKMGVRTPSASTDSGSLSLGSKLSSGSGGRPRRKSRKSHNSHYGYDYHGHGQHNHHDHGQDHHDHHDHHTDHHQLPGVSGGHPPPHHNLPAPTPNDPAPQAIHPATVTFQKEVTPVTLPPVANPEEDQPLAKDQNPPETEGQGQGQENPTSNAQNPQPIPGPTTDTLDPNKPSEAPGPQPDNNGPDKDNLEEPPSLMGVLKLPEGPAKFDIKLVALDDRSNIDIQPSYQNYQSRQSRCSVGAYSYSESFQRHPSQSHYRHSYAASKSYSESPAHSHHHKKSKSKKHKSKSKSKKKHGCHMKMFKKFMQMLMMGAGYNQQYQQMAYQQAAYQYLVQQQQMQPRMGQVGITPMQSMAFNAQQVDLSSSKADPNKDSNNDHNHSPYEESPEEIDDGVAFAYKPQPNGRTEVTFTVEPKKQPWLTMMRFGFRPVVNCTAPPCFLTPSNYPGMQVNGGRANLVNNAYAGFPTLNQLQQGFQFNKNEGDSSSGSGSEYETSSEEESEESDEEEVGTGRSRKSRKKSVQPIRKTLRSGSMARQSIRDTLHKSLYLKKLQNKHTVGDELRTEGSASIATSESTSWKG